MKTSAIRRWLCAVPWLNLWLAVDVTEAGVRISAPLDRHETGGKRVPRRPMKRRKEP